MTKAPPRSAFTVFGVEPRLDLDDRTLEQRYLQLSRECHPDRNRANGAADCAAVLARAAEINDSWRVLRDRWRRARELIETEAPGELAEQKQLDPEFLAEALELAESVAMAEPPAFAALHREVRAGVDRAWAKVASAAARADWAAAARALHESKYVCKAAADLEQRMAGPEA